MKLIRFGPSGEETPGIQRDDGVRIDASGFGADYDEDFFAGDGIDRLRDWVAREGDRASRIGPGVRVGPPIVRPSKIICIGLNFRDHARESAMDLPSEPVLFFKSTSSLCGPNDPLVMPRGATKVDWEVELAFVVGKRASYVDEADALEHVAGYVLHNDYSERAFQLEGTGQWVKGKSADTFAPLGPFLATSDEIDPGALRLWLTVNGASRQDSNTDQMVFGVAALLSYVSRFMTLLPGDVISTGTPAGVALGMDSPKYLQPGDVVELGVDGLGTQRQEVVPYEAGGAS